MRIRNFESIAAGVPVARFCSVVPRPAPSFEQDANASIVGAHALTPAGLMATFQP